MAKNDQKVSKWTKTTKNDLNRPKMIKKRTKEPKTTTNDLN